MWAVSAIGHLAECDDGADHGDQDEGRGEGVAEADVLAASDEQHRHPGRHKSPDLPQNAVESQRAWERVSRRRNRRGCTSRPTV
jgi:hypothetical protein